eukprot:GEMP01007421.1.p1 GENE.GEMP01007421.1~~GEMP01007421.1.p1  ORF type:complete len:888 (+),score=109.41 GEMP01007421.1:50-2713(+)
MSYIDPWKGAILADLGGDSGDHLPHATKTHGAAYLIVRSIFPWLLTIVLGVCVALTGVYIAYNCDFLADLRFGYCHNLFIADRKRCCGGVENFDEKEQRCIQAEVNLVGSEATFVNWIPWEELFGLSSRTTSAVGYIVAFIVYFMTCVVMTGVSCLLVHFYSPSAKGSGIPEVKASVGGFDLPNVFQARCLLIKSLGLSLAVGAGLSLGKEGPLIHVGVCWAHLLSSLSPFGSNRVAFRGTLGTLLQGIPRNELAAIGAATGVSTAFGAPLGGVLFAVEELGSVRQLSKRCLILCFLGSFSSSFCLKYMNLSGANTIILFGLSQSSKNKYAKEWVAADIWIYVFLGVLGGLWGAAFVHMNCAVAKRRKQAREEGYVWMFPKKSQRAFLEYLPGFIRNSLSKDAGIMHPAPVAIFEGLVVAAITGLVNFPFSKLLKFLTVEATNALFETCPDEKGFRFGLCAEEGKSGFLRGSFLVMHLIFAASVRLFLTVITFGMSVPSGLFIPSLFIGACLGRAVGTILMMFTDAPIEPGSFALIGASAMLGGFSRLTVSLVVIMFELTGDITQVVPVMCACLTAKIVGDYFNESIYDEHAVLSGFAIAEDLPDHVRFHAVCGDVMEVIDADFVVDATSVVDVPQLAKLLDVNIRKRTTMRAGGLGGVCRDLDMESETIPLPSVILLKRSKYRAIFGAVETELLRRWLHLNNPVDANLTFTCANEGPLLGIATPKNPVGGRLIPTPSQLTPETQSIDGVSNMIFRSFEEFVDEETSSGISSSTDLSHFVDTHIARVESNAPITIAYFIFHQNPLLKYIICLSRFSRGVGVISRTQFREAISSGRLAYPPLNPLTNDAFGRSGSGYLSSEPPSMLGKSSGSVQLDIETGSRFTNSGF